MGGRTTGRSVRTLIRARKPGGETRGSITIRVRLAPISERGIVRRVTRVSSHTAYLSVGYTLLAIVRSLVKTERVVVGGFVFSLTRLSNSGFCHLSRVRGVLTRSPTRSSRTTVLLSGMRSRLPVLKLFRLCLLPPRSRRRRLLRRSLLPCLR